VVSEFSYPCAEPSLGGVWVSPGDALFGFGLELLLGPSDFAMRNLRRRISGHCLEFSGKSQSQTCTRWQIISCTSQTKSGSIVGSQTDFGGA
jgi:hypothetical protein